MHIRTRAMRQMDAERQQANPFQYNLPGYNAQITPAQFFKLFEYTDLADIQQLASQIDLSHCVDDTGRNAVLTACLYGRIDVLRWLVKDKHQSLNCQDKEGDDPVMTAVYAGHIDLLHELVKPKDEGGFGLRFQRHPFNHYQNPVLRAIFENKPDMLRALVTPVAHGGFGLSLNTTDDFGLGSVIYAANVGSFAIMRSLLTPAADGGYGLNTNKDEILNFPYDTASASRYLMTVQHSRISPDKCERVNVHDMQTGTTESYKLGKMLGQGTYGMVHEFTYNGKKIAAKVPQSTWQRYLRTTFKYEWEEIKKEFGFLTRAYPRDGLYCLQALFKKEGNKNFFTWRMVMPFIAGVHLDRVLTKYTEPLRAAKIILATAEELHRIHTEAKFVHGDIRSRNIMVAKNQDGDDSIHFIDFGFSENLGDLVNNTLDSYKFFAPERELKGMTAKTSQDVWSFARTIQWCLAGVIMEDFNKIKETDITLDGFPAISQLFIRGMDLDPERRMQLPEFIDMLREQINEYEYNASQKDEASNQKKRELAGASSRMFKPKQQLKNDVSPPPSEELVVEVKRAKC